MLDKIRAALLILSMTAAGIAGAAELKVPGDWKTIQGAIDKAAPGDTVTVGEGLYNENVTINKPLALRSEKGADLTVVRAAVKTEPAIKIADSNGVSLEGFGATGSKIAGVLVSNSSGVRLLSNKSLENGNGIILYHSKDSVVKGNTANKNESYGIYLESTTGSTIEKNIANSNQDKGFFVSYSNNNNILDNNANLNTWNGMVIWSSHNNVLRNNQTLRNTFGMVFSESDDNTSEDNTTLPNVFIILPIVLIYIGIISYLVQKNVLRLVYRS